jgi:hypothetical protein
MKVNLINEETFRFDSLDQNKQENIKRIKILMT